MTITTPYAHTARNFSSRIELELREVYITVGSLESAFQEQRTILDRTSSLAINQGQLLQTLQQELRQSIGLATVPERLETVHASPVALAHQSSINGVTLESAPSWSTTVNLRLIERRDRSCKC